MALPTQRPDGTQGELQMDEYERLKIERGLAGEPGEGFLVELRQTDEGELLTAQGGG
jgi:hypothetical protein